MSQAVDRYDTIFVSEYARRKVQGLSYLTRITQRMPSSEAIATPRSAWFTALESLLPFRARCAATSVKPWRAYEPSCNGSARSCQRMHVPSKRGCERHGFNGNDGRFGCTRVPHGRSIAAKRCGYKGATQQEIVAAPA
jgi:hypothetical protein